MCCSVLHFVTLGNPEFVSHHSFVHNALNLGLAVLYVAVCCILLRSASQSSSSTTPSPITPSICVVLCYVLQCVAFCCTWQRKVRAPPLFCPWSPQRVSCYSMYCSVLQYVAVCCSVLQRVAACCSVLQCVAVCCSVLQCVAVCCSVLQCIAFCCTWPSEFESHCSSAYDSLILCQKKRASMLQCNAACVAPRERVRHTYL